MLRIVDCCFFFFLKMWSCGRVLFYALECGIVKNIELTYLCTYPTHCTGLTDNNNNNSNNRNWKYLIPK